MRAVLTAEVAEFAAQREEVMSASDDELKPIVEDALDEYRNGVADWFNAPVEAAAVLWWETFEYEQGRPPTATELAEFQSVTADVLDRTSVPTDPVDDTQVNAITGWLSAYALNSATAAGGGPVEWVTRQDGDVRDIHVPLDGDQVAGNGTFDVAGYALHFPGEPVGPPHVWINCRCVARQVKEDEMTVNTRTAAADAPVTYNINLYDTATDARPGTAHPEIDDDPGEDDTGYDQEVDGEDYDELDSDVPWHGIIAPTGVMSGDRRKFATDALRHRDLPLPVKFQKADAEGHGGAVVVANMTNIEERDGLIRAEGVFHTSSESSEAIGLIANQMLRGLSVDLDDATFELQYEDGSPFDMNDEDGDPIAVVTDGRVASVTLCSIPAFQEAYISLGTWADADADDAALAAAGCVPCAAREMDALYETWTAYAISEAAWDGSPSRFTDEEYYRSCVVHKNGTSTAKSDNSLPILEPNGDLNRAAVHAAAGRVDQVDAPPAEVAKGKRSLVTAYRKLKEDPPESLTAGAVFAPGTKDGPGWVTNPKETQRLRTYWTRGKGAAKIRWGQPGDFNRCRRQLAKYVPNPEFLAGTCANLHKEAIGIWPGQEGGSKGRHSGATLTAAAFTIVASGAGDLPDAFWFTNPELPEPTPLTIDGRRIYGHVAAWTSCHTGYGISVGDGEVCVRPPNSSSNYAYFHTGQIETDAGKVNVGHITMDTGHAAASLAGRPAAAHYDNTGAVIADIVCGEDEHGIWFSGALRPEVTDSQRIALGAAALSGDWRRLGGNYELIAALCVNVPGFPIPRTAIAASAAAGQYTLVAAGIVPQDTTPSLQDAIRNEIALMRLEDARAVLRAQTVARVHKLQADHARGRLAAINHHHL
jgi:hypothetical protein